MVSVATQRWQLWLPAFVHKLTLVSEQGSIDIELWNMARVSYFDRNEGRASCPECSYRIDSVRSSVSLLVIKLL